MGTVFMRWLETTPRHYDRGIALLTLGQIQRVRARIADTHVRSGMRVLEIGCGTGTLTAMMTAQGAEVIGIDTSPHMLAEAEKRIAAAGLEEKVSLQRMDATLIGERFAAGSFDLIVSTLVFSELSSDEQCHVLDACAKLLAPGGRLLIADEVVPAGTLRMLSYYAVRLPLRLLTWLLTRTTTTPLRRLAPLLSQTGFHACSATPYLSGSLVLYDILPAGAARPDVGLPTQVAERLVHRVTLRTLVLDLWLLFFRMIPPYPRVRTGLYAVGDPTSTSPVLVTGNYSLTVRRLVRAIDGHADAWVLVADSAGINVWCAAGGGFFTSDKVIAAVESSRLEDVVAHHTLILPQLCANGVDGWRIRRELGWRVRWGPARASDIPAYLTAGCNKTDAMRWVRFPLVDRLEMVTVALGFYALLILLPVLFLWREMFAPIAISMVGLSYFYAVVHPWLPGRDGLYKSIPLALIALAGLFAYTTLLHPLPALDLYRWAIGLTGLSVFTGAELQGMSPLMRGEQANWRWEALIGLVLAAAYVLVPLVLGWR